MFELTQEQAKELAILAIGENVFKANTPIVQLQTVMGVMALVLAMQELGYRITPPLKEVNHV